MVEARIAILENLFPSNEIVDKSMLSEILSEEQEWAEKANKEREEYIMQMENEKRIEK